MSADVKLTASKASPREVRIVVYRGSTTISMHVGDGSFEQHPVECEHQHVDYDAAIRCSDRLARAALKNPEKFGLDTSRYVPWPANGYRVVDGKVVEA